MSMLRVRKTLEAVIWKSWMCPDFIPKGSEQPGTAGQDQWHYLLISVRGLDFLLWQEKPAILEEKDVIKTIVGDTRKQINEK